uniref:CSON011856 protein n=1 Tax=Culicoides sonorensis TaxID=179676 RepID=A0A336LGM4_CULSO
MKYDKFTPSEVEGSDAESGIGERPNSSFKFMGNFDDSSEILRRSPDFDAVIMLLQDEIDNIRQVNPAASLEALIKKSQEITIKESAQNETEISLESVKAQRLNILKKIGPPWTWIDKFTDYKCLTESFNFIDSTSGMLEDDDESHEVIVNTMKRRSTSADSSQTIIHYTSDESRSKTFIRDESEEESPSKVNTKSIINQVLSDVMCKLTEAQSNGKCSVRDVRSLTRIIDGEFGSDESAMKLKGFLEKANSNGQDFNDLNELNSYFMSEIVKENRINVNEDDEEDPNETLKEPDDPDRIVEIFEESGIDVDNKLLEKKVSETMILGLVKKPGTADSLAPPPSDIDVESVKLIQSDDTTTASMAASSHKPQAVTKDENIQTTPYLERQRQKLANENAEHQLNENEAEKGDDESYKAIIPPLPGIGPSVSHETTERFLLYLMRRARKQGGMVYPRNWQESECPSMVD